MQICRFCGKLIPMEQPYNPREIWICNACINRQQVIDEENLRKAIKDGIEKQKRDKNGDNHYRNYKINNKQAFDTA